MLTTIVFFFALFFSISTFVTIIEWQKDRLEEGDEELNEVWNTLLFLTITTCLLWSWLYWLSH